MRKRLGISLLVGVALVGIVAVGSQLLTRDAMASHPAKGFDLFITHVALVACQVDEASGKITVVAADCTDGISSCPSPGPDTSCSTAIQDLISEHPTCTIRLSDGICPATATAGTPSGPGVQYTIVCK